MAKHNQTREPKGKLTLFLGPFQPELEEAFFLWVRKKKEKDPFAALVVLVGSNLLGLYLRRLLAQRGLNHINLRFLTFIDLARALAVEPLGRNGFLPLPRYGDLILNFLPGRENSGRELLRPDRRPAGVSAGSGGRFPGPGRWLGRSPAFVENPQGLRSQRAVPGLPFAGRQGFLLLFRPFLPRRKGSATFSPNVRQRGVGGLGFL
jgi:hypothetical protein